MSTRGDRDLPPTPPDGTLASVPYQERAGEDDLRERHARALAQLRHCHQALIELVLILGEAAPTLVTSAFTDALREIESVLGTALLQRDVKSVTYQAKPVREVKDGR